MAHITYIYGAFNLGAEQSEIERCADAYDAALTAKLATAYTGVEIEVCHEMSEMTHKIDTDLTDRDAEDEIESIAQATFEAGDWWPAVETASEQKAHAYRITNTVSGLVLGTFPGNSPEEALDALARDAGYESHAAAQAVAGEAELQVEEEEPEPTPTYEIQMDSPVGPRVLSLNDATIEEIEAALPAGWTVDWTSQTRIRPAGTDTGWTYSAPLVRVEAPASEPEETAPIAKTYTYHSAEEGGTVSAETASGALRLVVEAYFSAAHQSPPEGWEAGVEETVAGARIEIEGIWHTVEVATEPAAETEEDPKKLHHSTRVVTYSAPSGGQIDVCTACAKRFTAAKAWPRNGSGEEYCQVSRGDHHGLCTYDTSEEPEDRLSGWADSQSFGDAVQRRPAAVGGGWIYRHWDGGLASYRSGLGPYATHTIRW